MAIKFAGVADFNRYPQSEYPFMVGIWDAYEVNFSHYRNQGVEIADWCRAICGEYKIDWWAYQAADREFAMFYFKPRNSALFKLTWIGI